MLIKAAKLNLIVLHAKALKLEGKPKSSLVSLPNPWRTQNKQVKTSLLV